MASLATGCYLKEGYIGAKKPYLVTFGQPRFGDQACCEFINSRSHVTRFIHGIDPIPKVPVEGMGYKHIGQVKYLTKEKSSQCELIGQEEYERRTQISDLEDPERILNWVIVRVCR